MPRITDDEYIYTCPYTRKEYVVHVIALGPGGAHDVQEIYIDEECVTGECEVSLREM